MFRKISSLFLGLGLCASMALAQSGQPVISDHLDLSNDHIEKSDGGTGGGFIGGTVSNMGDKVCDVVVNVNVFGPSHTFLSNKFARRNSLQPSDTWDFHIPVGPRAESYEILSVKARWYQNQPASY
jgi:hypothetical protein